MVSRSGTLLSHYDESAYSTSGSSTENPNGSTRRSVVLISYIFKQVLYIILSLGVIVIWLMTVSTSF